MHRSGRGGATYSARMGDSMKVKFVEFYQGVKTHPHAYYPGDVAEVDDEAGAELIDMGKAEQVKVTRSTKAKGKNDES